MASYLATIQIGGYEQAPGRRRRRPVPMHAVTPPRLRAQLRPRLRAPAADDGRRSTELFGPYPFADYTVVVTDDELEIPIEAQGLSIFGANHCDGRRGAERLVAHELAHQWFGNSLTARRGGATSGCTRASPVTRSGSGPRTPAGRPPISWPAAARAQPRRVSRRTSMHRRSRARAACSTTGVYKRGALTLHALRSGLGDDAILRAAALVDRGAPALDGDHPGVHGSRRTLHRTSRCDRCGTPGCTRNRCRNSHPARHAADFDAPSLSLG